MHTTGPHPLNNHPSEYNALRGPGHQRLCPPSIQPRCGQSAGAVDSRRWLFLIRGAVAGDGPTLETAGDPALRTPRMARIEAVLLVATGAISTRRMLQLAMLADISEVREVIEQLNTAYDAVGTPFRIERVATGYQLLTRPEYVRWLDKLHHRQSALKLSSPAMETLTIVAYRQPITRADLEAIRGVQSSEMLKQLMERNLVRIAGEDDSLGRPYLYGTTRQFLELFGLRNLDDLPMSDKLRKTPETGSDPPAGTDDDTDADSNPPDPQKTPTIDDEAVVSEDAAEDTREAA